MKPSDCVKLLWPFAEQVPGVSSVFQIAQGCLESGWLDHKVGNYNIFGITKGSSWKGKTVLITTREVFKSPNVKFTTPEEVISVTPGSNGKFNYKVKRLFRDYDSYADCFADHYKIFLGKAFKDDLQYANDPIAFTKAIQEGNMTYATDPNYVKTMTAMIRIIIREADKLGLLEEKKEIEKINSKVPFFLDPNSPPYDPLANILNNKFDFLP